MVRKRIRREIFRYQCSMTGEDFKTTRKAENPDELVSVAAYYELHPEMDDRPENIKRETQISENTQMETPET